MISEPLRRPLSLFDVKDKVAIITGASGTFGRATALALTALGGKMLLASGSKDELDTVAGEVRELGGDPALVVRRPDSQADAEAMLDSALAAFGRIDQLVVAGSLESGFNSLQSLSGTVVSAPKALELVYVALVIYLIPIAAIVCIGLLLSTLTRNSAAAVVGTLMVSLLIQLIGILPGLSGAQPYLLSTQFNAWQGLLRTPIDWTPIVQAIWVCALYAVPCLVAAFLVFIRRDVAGG